MTKAGYRDGWHLYTYGGDDQARFCNDIGVHGACSLKVSEVAHQLSGNCINTNLHTVPVEVWNRVRGALRERDMSHRDYAAVMGTQPARTRLAKVATILKRPERVCRRRRPPRPSSGRHRSECKSKKRAPK